MYSMAQMLHTTKAAPNFGEHLSPWKSRSRAASDHKSGLKSPKTGVFGTRSRAKVGTEGFFNTLTSPYRITWLYLLNGLAFR
jgi:hypothetical protein